MFTALFKKKSKSRDLRFVDVEAYSNRQSFTLRHAPEADNDSFIRVEKSFNTAKESSFLEQIRHATTEGMVVEESLLDETIELGLPSNHPKPNNVHRFDFDKVSSADLKQLSGLGVFSDSKIYSALIHSVLAEYHLNIQHFNHPNTFKAGKYPLFDSISAWIIFLSDDNESDFLDLFLDRYVEKPTLFLFSKLNKDASIKRINQFIQQHNLHVPISETVLHEIED